MPQEPKCEKDATISELAKQNHMLREALGWAFGYLYKTGGKSVQIGSLKA